MGADAPCREGTVLASVSAAHLAWRLVRGIAIRERKQGQEAEEKDPSEI